MLKYFDDIDRQMRNRHDKTKSELILEYAERNGLPIVKLQTSKLQVGDLTGCEGK